MTAKDHRGATAHLLKDGSKARVKGGREDTLTSHEAGPTGSAAVTQTSNKTSRNNVVARSRLCHLARAQLKASPKVQHKTGANLELQIVTTGSTFLGTLSTADPAGIIWSMTWLDRHRQSETCQQTTNKTW
jgi:hypothetical protein